MKYDLICHETARLVTGNILDGNVCGGRSCKMYKTCAARIKFDALPKYAPTDAQIMAAVEHERKYGVRTDVADVLNDPSNDTLVKTVYIPSRYCDTWQNPCGHVDKYADCRAEAAAKGLNGGGGNG